MVFEIGVNLRVTECLDKGDRDYMEDFTKYYFEHIDGSIVFGFFGIFDGHGGSEAASFAKKTLINEIKNISLFWSENDSDVLSAIRQGFLKTHEMMWAERENWFRNVTGFESTAGTTATVAIVRNRKLYIGHVGDSACVIGFSKVLSCHTDLWEATCLTVEHKPTNVNERQRLEDCGASLIKKSGVERVVWRRQKLNNPDQGNFEGDSITHEEVPFLAVTRSLGDLWSYDHDNKVYHVSPEPDIQCIPLDSIEHRCLILGSDGLWNVMSTKAVIEIVRICERETERRVFLDPNVSSAFFYNPAASLVKYALAQWKRRHARADNVSALVIMIDPPGPSMTKRREDRRNQNLMAMDLQNIFVNNTPTYENFSKLLSKEFLIECDKWRSANDPKNVNELTKANPRIDMYCDPTYSFEAPPLTLGRRFVDGKSVRISPGNAKMATNSNLYRDAIMSDNSFSKYCVHWTDNAELWEVLAKFFEEDGLFTELEVINFLNSCDPDLSREILRIIPWICSTKEKFKENSRLNASLNAIPMFCDFWVDLYVTLLKPFENPMYNHKALDSDTVLDIVKPGIIKILKHHNYFLNQPVINKVPSQYQTHDNNKNNDGKFVTHGNPTVSKKSKRGLHPFGIGERSLAHFRRESRSAVTKRRERRESKGTSDDVVGGKLLPIKILSNRKSGQKSRGKHVLIKGSLHNLLSVLVHKLRNNRQNMCSS